MIWYVEDDPGIRDLVIYTLNATGFETRSFETGDECWKALQSGMPELLLLDGMLPGMDGVELLQKMKQDPCLREIPVIMASARGAEFDKIRSLDLGADDYLVKPFGMLELVSRVKAVLRRCGGEKKEALLQVGGLVLNPTEHTVSVKPGEDPTDPSTGPSDPSTEPTYDLTPITDEQTPLANVGLEGDHTCCLMHFLIMLVSMITLGFYTSDRKKLQKSIFEVKKALKAEGVDVDEAQEEKA